MLANEINTLARFLGPRDIHDLSQTSLQAKYGFKQADVFVLFGGSILAGVDTLAQAIRSRVAKHYVIVGGAGHTTQTLRDQAQQLYPDFPTAGITEAQLFNQVLFRKYGLLADYLEEQSTNCGNNITYLLKLLEEQQIDFNSIILCQDATMQTRMAAGLRKYRPDVKIINYPAYQVTVQEVDGRLSFDRELLGMWSMDRYLTLLMGEIPRLRDDQQGYGPRGKDYIAHVEIPLRVEQAFTQLMDVYGDHVRQANPAFASSRHCKQID